MKQDDGYPGAMPIGAAVLFLCIAVVVLIAFEPTRDLFCGRYEARGISGIVGSFVGEDPSCLRNFLYDFQTLITGALAVVAATTTIGVMIYVDRAVQIRHDQVVDLQLRQDKIRMQRALRPQLNELNEWLTGLTISTFFDPAHTQKPGDPLWHAMVAFGRTGNNTLILLKETLDRQQFRDGVSLFDGETTWTLDQLDSILGSTIGAVRHHLSIHDEDTPSSDSVFYEDDFSEFAEQLKTNIFFCIEIAEQLAVNLERLAREYKV